MNANELMIGDWVKVNPFTRLSHIIPERFESMLEEEIQVSVYNISGYVRFHPIPLTEDILNANDIEWEFYDCYHFHFNHKGVDLHLSGFFHVHELQHALRLCGLNELADNFKIK